ncbi:MAG: DUF2085 domain-containing protein [Pyrinomonadaceae bacterium]
MKLSAENYIPQFIAKDMKKKAMTAWVVGFSIVFIWLFVILLAPVAAAHNLQSVSTPIYSFFSYLCHQMPERSFHLENHSFAVCARCFGVYFGLLAGFIIYPLFRSIEETEPLPRFWLFLSLIPISIDWSLGIFGIWENNHLSRFITGTILGFACAVFIIPAIVELAQLLSRKNAIKKAV